MNQPWREQCEKTIVIQIQRRIDFFLIHYNVQLFLVCGGAQRVRFRFDRNGSRRCFNVCAFWSLPSYKYPAILYKETFHCFLNDHIRPGSYTSNVTDSL